MDREVAAMTRPSSRLAPHIAGAGPLPGGSLTAGGGGLMIGRDRHKAPVVLQVLRPEPTRAALVGQLSFAQLFALRTIALGARIIVQTIWSREWGMLAQRTGIGPEYLVYATPGEVLPPTATAARPEVVLVDVGAVNWASIDTSCGWRTTVVVRHELAPVDAELLGGADLVLMQPLTVAEAAVAAPALGVVPAEPWLSRIAGPMVTIASQGTVRWATLDPTELELHTVGTPNRFPTA